jgi:hypothetical protein
MLSTRTNVYQHWKKLSVKLLLIISTFTFTIDSLARKEIPFCPAGGPPGWMNYFDHKRDENKWRRYKNIPPAYNQYYYPVYGQPQAFPVYPYISRPDLKTTRY